MKEKLKANLHFFNIERCGWYDSKNSFVHTLFPDLISSFQSWLPNRPFMNTNLTTAVESGTFNANLNTYIYALDAFDYVDNNTNHKAYLLTLWEEIQTTRKREILAINKDAKLGSISSSDIKTNKFGANVLPGTPYFFILLPKRDLVITISNDSYRSGFGRLETYLLDFLRHGINANTASTQLATSPNNISKHKALFKGRKVKAPTNISNLKNAANDITRVVYKKSLKRSDTVDMTFYQQFMDKISSGTSNTLNKDANIKAELSMSPTPQEIDEFITKWEANPTYDLGFAMKGGGSTTWVDTVFASQKYELTNVTVNNGMPDPKSIANKIAPLLSRILNEHERQITP